MRRKLQSLQMDSISARLSELDFHLHNFGMLNYAPNRTLKNSFLPYFRIVIISFGSFRVDRDTIHYPLQTGDLIMIPPSLLYSAHSLEEEGQIFYLDFGFDTPSMEQQFRELFHFQDVILLPNLINERQRTNLTHLDRTVEIGYPGTYLLVQCMLIRILVVMLKRLCEEPVFLVSHPQNAKEQLLKECIEYIDAHLNEPLTVKEIAAHFNYSENYIYRIFQETLQISCKSYILEYRLSKALQDLKSSNLSMTDISMKYGFSSIYHFSSAFKKKYGYSPLNFRKEMEK